MGIFSKIKNFVTGGAADVSVVFEQRNVDGVSPVRLFVVAKANDSCKVKKVYLQMRGRETYLKRVTRTTTDSDGNSTTTVSHEQHHDDHYKTEMIMAEGVSLQKGEEQKWLAELNLPDQVLSTFHGKEVHFKWEVFAGLDMPGNDPDSGWQEFIVTKNMNYTLDHC